MTPATPFLTRPARIGLYGGTFDPIHAAHLLLAHSAIEQLALDRVLFIVSGTPAQKSHAADPGDRVRMVELAIAGDARLQLELIEVERHGPSYAIDTVIALRERFGPLACLAWLMGSDQYSNLPTWRRHGELLEYVNIAVARRADDTIDLPALHQLRHPHGDMASFEMPAHTGAASNIREAIAEGHDETLALLLHPDVLDYIRLHNLYNNGRPPNPG
ncbi:nicotinate-nucleotide adenylyltransferase [soil metagenome]